MVIIMKLVIIFGPAAVGKMTVGHELSLITNLSLFHNHVSIEPVVEVFGEYKSEVVNKVRDVFFTEFLKTDKYGLIFTYVWDLTNMADYEYINNITYMYQRKGAEIYFVGLAATKETVLERNGTEFRKSVKASKRDSKKSESFIHMSYDVSVPCSTSIRWDNYLFINNDNLSPKEVAQRIKEKFGFIKIT